MTEKKYLAVRCAGIGLDKTLQTLRKYVRERHLAELIPFVTYEKGAQARRKFDYYIFLEVHSKHSGKPPELERLFREIQLGRPLDQWLTAEDLKRMCSAPESTQFFRQIYVQSARAYKSVPPDNLFGRADQDLLALEINDAFDRLLHWLSVLGGGTWQAFCAACEALNIADKPRHVFRRLRLLGHVEYLDHGTRWQVCPPCLVQSANNSYSYLIGQRTPSMLAEIAHQPAAQIGAPDLIKLAPESAPKSYHDLGVASLRLAERLPHWRALPERWQPIDLPLLRYRIERWDGAEFRSSGERPDQIGMYRFQDTDNRSERYAFYDGTQLRQGDWYGLQYIANAHMGKFPQCVYSEAHSACWLSAHLPDLYERALVLASGRLPEPVNDGWLFSGVSRALIERMSDKLGFFVSHED